MNKTIRSLAVGASALAIAAGVYAIPALAAGNANSPAARPSSMSGNTSPMSGLSQADFNTMAQLMSPLMTAMPALHTQMISDLASTLHMSPDALDQALNSGKSLSDIAAAQNIGVGEVRAAMTHSMQSVLDSQVAAKNITPEQAGRVQGLMETHLGTALTVPMTGSGMMGGLLR